MSRGPDYRALLLAQEGLLTAALQVLMAERGDLSDRHHGDDMEYAHEQLALRARDLVIATDTLPADEKPVGWRS